MSLEASEQLTFPWAKAAMLASPSIVFVLGAGVAGPRTVVGMVLLAAAASYLLIDLFLLQPRIERRMLAPGRAEAALQEFLERAGDASIVDEVADQMAKTLRDALGSDVRVALVAPDPLGGIRLISSDLELTGRSLSDAADAFLWLGEGEDPIWREQLRGIEDTGAVETIKLMDEVGANILLPLRHRGLLLGLALIIAPMAARSEWWSFLQALRVYATAALANTFLDAEAKGRSGLTETLGLANAIQESLMPEERPVRRPMWELRGFFRPVADCGGDLWGWRELGDEQVLLVIADATGHGAGPALLSAVAKGTIDAHAQVAGTALDPGQLMKALNDAILRVGRRHYMMTAFAAVVDCRRGMVRFANAGQNFPFMVSGGVIEVLVARGDSLGAGPGPQYQTHERQMTPGDKLILYTDGIVEAGAPAIEPYGERRFRRLIGRLAGTPAGQIPEAILSEVDGFLGQNSLQDDMTMVAFELSAQDQEIT